MPSSSNNVLDTALQVTTNAVVDPIQAAHQGLNWLDQNRSGIINAAAILFLGAAASGWLGRVAHRAPGTPTGPGCAAQRSR